VTGACRNPQDSEVGDDERCKHAAEPGRDRSEVIERFATSGVRCFVVLDDGRLVGVVAIRDVMGHLNKRGVDGFDDDVREVMTRDVVTVTPETSLEDVKERFRTHRFNHIPVVEDGRPVAVLTPRDVLGALVRESELANEYMRDYIAGSYS
jgi:CBS domain-containing protein